MRGKSTKAQSSSLSLATRGWLGRAQFTYDEDDVMKDEDGDGGVIAKREKTIQDQPKSKEDVVLHASEDALGGSIECPSSLSSSSSHPFEELILDLTQTLDLDHFPFPSHNHIKSHLVSVRCPIPVHVFLGVGFAEATDPPRAVSMEVAYLGAVKILLEFSVDAGRESEEGLFSLRVDEAYERASDADRFIKRIFLYSAGKSNTRLLTSTCAILDYKIFNAQNKCRIAHKGLRRPMRHANIEQGFALAAIRCIFPATFPPPSFVFPPTHGLAVAFAYPTSKSLTVTNSPMRTDISTLTSSRTAFLQVISAILNVGARVNGNEAKSVMAPFLAKQHVSLGRRTEKV
ncbi:hypothetical protein BDQ12DRAFT_729728 [Crucibulum laeve]|uniref:Uncharacterized protein n=1 Tax=Crucibulum laeve TaxID=68775 RepID=A0A5C3LGG3_9AGAR|nr:hypothetical protein BDQ12DRAFT_729728 [Crucibulum laeve]